MQIHVRIHLAREDNASTTRDLPPVLVRLSTIADANCDYLRATAQTAQPSL